MSMGLRFDKSNKQENYIYMAEDFNGKTHTGYVFVDTPWYSPEERWIYYIRRNDYSKVGNIGNDDGGNFIDTIVDKNTIRPRNQVNQIIAHLKDGDDVLIEHAPDDSTIKLSPGDKIPMEIWDN